jgi:hypothetical protein
MMARKLRQCSKEAGMWNLLKKNREASGEFREQLERAAEAASEARTHDELMGRMLSEQRAHAARCGECRIAGEELLEARVLLRSLPSNAQRPGPWFSSRVMSAIAAQKAAVNRAGNPWTAVPRFASRMVLVAAAVLLVASAWLYEKKTPARLSTTDSALETVFETSSPQANFDEVLISKAEREQ